MREQCLGVPAVDEIQKSLGSIAEECFGMAAPFDDLKSLRLQGCRVEPAAMLDPHDDIASTMDEEDWNGSKFLNMINRLCFLQEEISWPAS